VKARKDGLERVVRGFREASRRRSALLGCEELFDSSSAKIARAVVLGLRK